MRKGKAGSGRAAPESAGGGLEEVGVGEPDVVTRDFNVQTVLQREFDRIVAVDGLKAALRWRDSRYGELQRKGI